MLNSYIICPRQAWMCAHGISGDKDNGFLREGLDIHEQAYQKNHEKEKAFGENSIVTCVNTRIEVYRGIRLYSTEKYVEIFSDFI